MRREARSKKILEPREPSRIFRNAGRGIGTASRKADGGALLADFLNRARRGPLAASV